MNPNEQFYDEHVAPVLADLAKKCNERDMPFLCMVGNQKDNYTTKFIGDWQNPAVRLAFYALKCQGNTDLLIMALERDAEEYGDNSLYLANLRHYKEIIRKGSL